MNTLINLGDTFRPAWIKDPKTRIQIPKSLFFSTVVVVVVQNIYRERALSARNTRKQVLDISLRRGVSSFCVYPLKKSHPCFDAGEEAGCYFFEQGFKTRNGAPWGMRVDQTENHTGPTAGDECDESHNGRSITQIVPLNTLRGQRG